MRTICITVPEIAGEEEAARKHFAERRVNAQFLHGIHGVTSGLVSTLPYEFDNPGSGFNVGPKIISLAINHYMAWAACSLLPDDIFFILESDAKFPEDWSVRLNLAMRDLPEDWDVLFVGSCNCAGKPTKHIAGDVYQMWADNPHHAPQCSHATVYAAKVIPVLLETQRKFYTGIDLALVFHTLPRLKFFAILPRLVDQFNIVLQP